jgi:hypothetical protein
MSEYIKSESKANGFAGLRRVGGYFCQEKAHPK